MFVIKKIQKKKDSDADEFEIIGKIKESDFLSLKMEEEKKEKEKQEKEVTVRMTLPAIFELSRYIEGIGADPKTSFISLLFQQLKEKDEKVFNNTIQNYGSILRTARKHVEMIPSEIQNSILRVFDDFVRVDVSLLEFTASIGNHWDWLEKLPTDNKALSEIAYPKAPAVYLSIPAHRKLATLYLNRIGELEQRQNDLKTLKNFFKTKSNGLTVFDYFLPYAKSLRIIDAFGDLIMVD